MIIDKSVEPMIEELRKDGYKLYGKTIWAKKTPAGGYLLKKRCEGCGFFMNHSTGTQPLPKIDLKCPKNFCNSSSEIRFRGVN